MMESNWVDFKAVKAAVSMQMALDHYGINWLRKETGDLVGKCPIHQGDGKRAVLHIRQPELGPYAPGGSGHRRREQHRQVPDRLGRYCVWERRRAVADERGDGMTEGVGAAGRQRLGRL